MCNKVTTEKPGLAGLDCFKAGCEAGHFNRVLTRSRSGRPKFEKKEYSEVL